MSDRIFEGQVALMVEEKRAFKKIFIGEKISGVPMIDILTSNYERFTSDANLIARLNVELDLELADAVLIPHDLYFVRKNTQYKNYIRDLAKKCPVIVFSIGDYPTFVGSKNIVYLQTHFTSRIRKTNVIQIPYNAELVSDVVVNTYSSEPRSSFVGFVPRLTPRRILFGFRSMPFRPFKSNGGFIRKAMLIKLKKVSNVSVITRSKFGRAKGFSEEILAKNRSEYIQSINESHAVWAPRGDANQSVRLYEALSAGKLVIIPNSNMKIPFLFCSRHNFFVTVFYWSKNWDQQLQSYWKAVGEEDWHVLSKEMINVYFDIFHYPKFVEILFSDFLFSPSKDWTGFEHNCSSEGRCRPMRHKLL